MGATGATWNVRRRWKRKRFWPERRAPRPEGSRNGYRRNPSLNCGIFARERSIIAHRTCVPFLSATDHGMRTFRTTPSPALQAAYVENAPGAAGWQETTSSTICPSSHPSPARAGCAGPRRPAPRPSTDDTGRRRLLVSNDPAAHLTWTLAGDGTGLTVSRIDPGIDTCADRDHVMATRGASPDVRGRDGNPCRAPGGRRAAEPSRTAGARLSA